MQAKTFRKQTLLFAGIVAVLLVGLYGAFTIFDGAFVTDYSRAPTSKIFQSIFGVPPPGGVRRIIVTGHGFAQGHTVFVRIEAPRSVLDSLFPASPQLSMPYPLTYQEFLDRKAPVPDSAFRGKLKGDAEKAGWTTILLSLSLEYYSIDRTYYEAPDQRPMMWLGVAVVDRKAGIACLNVMR